MENSFIIMTSCLLLQSEFAPAGVLFSPIRHVFETVSLWLQQWRNPRIRTFSAADFYHLSFKFFFFFFSPLRPHAAIWPYFFCWSCTSEHNMMCRDSVVNSNRTPGADCRLFSSPSTLQNVQMSFDLGCFLWTRQLQPKAMFKKKNKINK